MIKVLHLEYFPSFARFPSSIFHNKLHITHDMVFKMKKIIKVLAETFSEIYKGTNLYMNKIDYCRMSSVKQRVACFEYDINI